MPVLVTPDHLFSRDCWEPHSWSSRAQGCGPPGDFRLLPPGGGCFLTAQLARDTGLVGVTNLLG